MAGRADLLTAYAEGYAAVAAAVEAVGPERLDLAADGGWTARQVVHHLADSEMTAAIRLRRLLAEDDPVIAGYDEEGFAKALRYESRPIEAALRAVEGARATSYELLLTLSDEDWQRAGTHTESGTYGVETWLSIYASHAHDHAAQIRKAAGL